LHFGEGMSDPTKKEIPINPPNVPTSIMLWRTAYMQSNILAGLTNDAVDKAKEENLKEDNKGASPSEIKRMKEATQQ
jgi:hypothetical protein